jgi:hypothetical protein
MKILSFAFRDELDKPSPDHPMGNRGSIELQELETYFTFCEDSSDIHDFLYQWFNFKLEAKQRKAFFQFCVEQAGLEVTFPKFIQKIRYPMLLRVFEDCFEIRLQNI